MLCLRRCVLILLRMTDTKARARTLYVRPEHQRVWNTAVANAAAQGVSLSAYIAAALMVANESSRTTPSSRDPFGQERETVMPS
jgi:hypothetical protein